MILLSILLIITDHHYTYWQSLRSHLASVFYPLQWFVDAPYRYGNIIADYFNSQQQLITKNNILKEKQLYLEVKLQKNLALENENKKLRELLKSPLYNTEKSYIAEILKVHPDSFTHQVSINKGKRNSVQVGQAIVDAHGIIGTITEVNEWSSKVLLLTDASFGISIENARNSTRAIAIGTGTYNAMRLQHIPKTFDIKEGDRLITSGLGGKYPRGYSVGIVTTVLDVPGEQFMKIQVQPTALLQESRHVLLLKSENLSSHRLTE